MDEEISSIDDILNGLNRELIEEINCDKKVEKADYLFSCLMDSSDQRLILHFFCKKLTKDEFESIEKNSFKAVHYLR